MTTKQTTKKTTKVSRKPIDPAVKAERKAAALAKRNKRNDLIASRIACINDIAGLATVIEDGDELVRKVAPIREKLAKINTELDALNARKSNLVGWRRMTATSFERTWESNSGAILGLMNSDGAFWTARIHTEKYTLATITGAELKVVSAAASAAVRMAQKVAAKAAK